MNTFYIILVISFFVQSINAMAVKSQGEEIEVELFEGDISDIHSFAITTENVSSTDNSPFDWDMVPTPWPEAVIPYRITGRFDRIEKDRIQAMMGIIENSTCVKFKIHSNEIRFMEIKRQQVHLPCHSFIGYKERRSRKMFLQDDCLDENGILHHLMHALGFYHEHSRFDRDEHVVIVYPNIMNDSMKNFKIRPFLENILAGVSYDFGSILHYPQYAYAKNKTLPTIVPKYDVEIKSDRLSSRDIAKIHRFYHCDRKSSVTTTFQPIIQILDPRSPNKLTCQKGNCQDVGGDTVCYDPSCIRGGVGCNAGGQGATCRFCGFGIYPACPGEIKTLPTCLKRSCHDIGNQTVCHDPSCIRGGEGCNAGGQGILCRFCGFGIYPRCPKKEKPEMVRLPCETGSCRDVAGQTVCFDPRCSWFGGEGCNADNQGINCRYCGFDDFPPCP